MNAATLGVASNGDEFEPDATATFTVSQNSDGTGVVAQSDAGATTWKVPESALVADRTYYWSVRVNGVSGASRAASDVTSGTNSFVTAADDAVVPVPSDAAQKLRSFWTT